MNIDESYTSNTPNDSEYEIGRRLRGNGARTFRMQILPGLQLEEDTRDTRFCKDLLFLSAAAIVMSGIKRVAIIIDKCRIDI
jgi:hypothetical protein